MNPPGPVPQAIVTGLERCARDERSAWEMPRRSNAEWAARADRLAEVLTRQAHWWAVLGRWVYRQELPDVLARAAMVASTSCLEHARSWSEMAGDWRGRDTDGECCEVIGGCGCGGDRAGVA